VANFAASINDTGGKFAISINTPAANLPSVSTTPAANLPLVSTTLAKLVAKFADGFVDTGGKVCQQYTQGLGGTDS
jgi:hypothetical protein